MTKQRKRGLGKGLDALLGASLHKPVPVSPSSIDDEIIVQEEIVVEEDGEIIEADFTADNGSDLKDIPHERLSYLPIDLLQPGRYQPRTDFNPEALEELSGSIKAQGIIQPIVVRQISDSRYEIIAGERRWRAAKLAELVEVPVIIKELNDEAAIAMSLIENIQREDLNPLEESRALQRLLEEFSLTHQQVADAVGKSRTTITNLLRVLTLHNDVKTMLEHGDIEMGHAKVLLILKTSDQIQAAEVIVAKGLSVRDTEILIKNFGSYKAKKRKSPIDPDVVRLQEQLTFSLGAKVLIKHGNKGSGKLQIHYGNLEELDGILEHISQGSASNEA